MVNENIKMDWNQNMEEVALAFEESSKYYTDHEKRIPSNIKKYLTIDSNTKKVTAHVDKEKALSFEKISNLVETILSKPDVAIETKKRILRNFIKIKKNFASKKLDLFTYFFFGKRKDSQIKASARIIEQGVLQLGLRKELKEEFNIQAARTLFSVYKEKDSYRYVGTNSKEELVEVGYKSKALSFEKVSILMKKILSDQNLSFSRKEGALKGFKVIKERFELKKFNWLVNIFFGKNAQVEAAETIIEQGNQQLAQEKAKLQERLNCLGTEVRELIKSNDFLSQFRKVVKEVENSHSKLNKIRNNFINKLLEKKIIDENPHIEFTECWKLYEDLCKKYHPAQNSEAKKNNEIFIALNNVFNEFKEELKEFSKKESDVDLKNFIEKIEIKVKIEDIKIRENISKLIENVDELKLVFEKLQGYVSNYGHFECAKIDCYVEIADDIDLIKEYTDLISKEKEMIDMPAIENIEQAEKLQLDESANYLGKEVAELIENNVFFSQFTKVVKEIKKIKKLEEIKNKFINKLLEKKIINSNKIALSECWTLYKDLCKEYHPDKNKDAKNNEMVIILNAFNEFKEELRKFSKKENEADLKKFIEEEIKVKIEDIKEYIKNRKNISNLIENLNLINLIIERLEGYVEKYSCSDYVKTDVYWKIADDIDLIKEYTDLYEGEGKSEKKQMRKILAIEDID